MKFSKRVDLKYSYHKRKEKKDEKRSLNEVMDMLVCDNYLTAYMYIKTSGCIPQMYTIFTCQVKVKVNVTPSYKVHCESE